VVPALCFVSRLPALLRHVPHRHLTAPRFPVSGRTLWCALAFSPRSFYTPCFRESAPQYRIPHSSMRSRHAASLVHREYPRPHRNTLVYATLSYRVSGPELRAATSKPTALQRSSPPILRSVRYSFVACIDGGLPWICTPPGSTASTNLIKSSAAGLRRP